MSTVNGFGTLYYGWRARPDGTAEATRWFVAAFFPVIPLYQHRIRVLNTRDDHAIFYLFAGRAYLVTGMGREVAEGNVDGLLLAI